ncbi:MAG: hypothetical protein HYZ42_15390 [Bacteroidetes bacterium]|nr:hypothetical protein [Bacteroidota bacterium]
MNEIDKIKTEISKLASYFENFELRPPVTNQINDLKEYYKDISKEIIDFYNFCDGFNAHLEDPDTGNIFSLEEHLYNLTEMRNDEYPLFNSLFPLRSDGSGNFDCIMFVDGIGNNSVIFNDSDYGLPSYIKASSLSSYISFLTEDLILRYQPNGKIKPDFDIDNPDPVETDWPFNAKQMILKDPELIKLYKDENYAQNFNEPEQLVKYLD